MEREEVKPVAYPTELLQKDWSKRNYFFFKGSQEFLNVVHDMEVRDDDVWIVTYPKCGTTWMQELVWLVLNDFNFEKALKTDLSFRSPYLEWDFGLYKTLSLKRVEDIKSPRVIKSHLPLPLLPKQLWAKKAKVVFVARNLKDAAVSSYYFFKACGLVDVNLNLDQFMKYMVENLFKTTEPFEQTAEFYALRNEPWVYYTSFEKMVKNLRGVIEDVCKFLNKPITEEQMQRMLKHLSFEEMKNNPTVQHTVEFEEQRKAWNPSYIHSKFIREGGVNKHKEILSPESNMMIDKYLVEQEAKHNISMDKLLLFDEI